MDVAAHLLAGYAVARLGADRLAPRATMVMTAASVLPDLDQVLRVAGPVAFLAWHQTFTHSWVLAPVWALGLTALFRLLGPLPWIRSVTLALFGWILHGALDQLTAPGVAALWPLSSERWEFDLLGPADFWPALILSLAVIVPFLSNLVSFEIGANRGRGRGSAGFAVALLVLYLGAKAQLRATAIEVVNSRIYGGAVARRVVVCPNSFDPAAWLAIVETAQEQRVLVMNLRQPFDPEAGETLHQANHPAIVAARRSVLASRLAPYLGWAHWEAIPVGDRMEVTGEDLRLGLVLRFEVDSENRIVDESLEPR